MTRFIAFPRRPDGRFSGYDRYHPRRVLGKHSVSYGWSMRCPNCGPLVRASLGYLRRSGREVGLVEGCYYCVNPDCRYSVQRAGWTFCLLDNGNEPIAGASEISVARHIEQTNTILSTIAEGGSA
jgi:hypothetical protein